MAMTENRPQTRIQREKREIILEAALDVFSSHGFRGATIDQIAEAAGMSKPNLLYYFKTKEAIFETLIHGLLDMWLDPLKEMDEADETFSQLMGDVVEPRRDFIQANALYASVDV